MGGGGDGGTDEKEKMEGTKKLQKSYFDVLGLCCSSEVPLIEKILKPLEGVRGVSVIVPSRTVIVLHDNLVISQLQIVKVLNQARLEANVKVLGETNYEKKWPSPYALACGALLLLSFLKFVYHPFQWLALGAVAIGICPIFLKGVAALRNYSLDSNILMLIAVIGSIALRDYWEAGSIVFLFTIAQWLEARASHKATAVMSSLINIVPRKAVLAGTGEEVDADDVKLNTILAVKAGEIIPIDGVVVQGKCEVDEKTLTGESFPVPKQKDSTVWAGTINLNGYISIKTTALAEDSMVARMAKLVEEAQNKKSKAQRLIDKCAKYYTPAVVAISACLAAIPAILRLHDQKHWFHLALVVLVSACPCALILSTPVATFCALSKAATSGLLVKGGEYLETLSKIKIVAFDKTGTITRGEFVVTDFQSLSNEVSLNTLLYWVSSIESKSSHPMGAALVDYGRSLSIEPKPESVEEFENFPGEGIHGRIDGKDVYVGNRRIALRAGCATVPSVEGGSKERNSIGYIFLGVAPAGIFSLSDVCRTGVKEAISELKSMGIKTAMLTGDSNEAAILAQNQLEGALEIVQAELLPEDKARIIKEFEKEAPTAMIGDGLNDAPALATADIGISMGISGSALATETGHIILMSNDIRKIPKVIRLARRTHRKVIENVVFSILTKAAILALALAGHPLVWAAVLADVGTCVVVILNSMLLLRVVEQKRVKSCCKSSTSTHVHSHSHKHGCSGSIKAEALSKPHNGCCSHRDDNKKSSNSMSHNGCCSRRCDNKKSSNSVDTNGSCAPEDQIHENHGNGGCSQRRDSKKKNSADANVFCPQEDQIDGNHGNGCCSQRRDNKKNSNSADANIFCPQEDQIHGNHGNGCCSRRRDNKKNSNSADANGFWAQEDQIHGSRDIANQSEGSNCKYKQCCLAPSAPIPISQDMELESDLIRSCVKSHIQSHIVDEEVGHACGETIKCQFPNHKVESECKEIYNHKMGCAASDHACLHLEKRQIGGCCKSFRKECCGKSSGHFGASFGGGLSEIVIE